jgi:hypothetical protein
LIHTVEYGDRHARLKQFTLAPDHLQVRVTIAGPEPGYVATPIFLVEAAAELLEKRMDICLAVGSGGVCTPGQLLLLHGGGYVARLQEQGISIVTTVFGRPN